MKTHLRVLLVNSRHFVGGGDSVYTFNLAELLRGGGHEVAFFAMQDERNRPDPNQDLFVSHIDFREMNRRKSPVAGLRVLWRGVFSREARRKFRGLVERWRPDLVHLQNIHAHMTPSVILEARQLGLPVVWTVHDYKLVCPNTHFLVDASANLCEACAGGTFYHAILNGCKKGSRLASAMAVVEAYAHRWSGVTRQVDLFLSPSAFLAGKLIQHGLPPQKVRHLPLFLPDQLFEGERSAGDHLLFLGKLELKKGVRQLLEACRLAPQVRLVLAGQADEIVSEELRTRLPPSAEYLGMKHGSELRRLLGSCLAVVLPSVWYENQPMSILEGFAMGKPAIASDLGGMRELVGDGERGLLVRPGDAAALAETMVWMTNHPREAQQMGRAAREYAVSVHSADRHLAEIERVYAQVLGQSAGSLGDGRG